MLDLGISTECTMSLRIALFLVCLTTTCIRSRLVKQSVEEDEAFPPRLLQYLKQHGYGYGEETKDEAAQSRDQPQFILHRQEAWGRKRKAPATGPWGDQVQEAESVDAKDEGKPLQNGIWGDEQQRGNGEEVSDAQGEASPPGLWGGRDEAELDGRADGISYNPNRMWRGHLYGKGKDQNSNRV